MMQLLVVAIVGGLASFPVLAAAAPTHHHAKARHRVHHKRHHAKHKPAATKPGAIGSPSPSPVGSPPTPGVTTPPATNLAPRPCPATAAAASGGGGGGVQPALPADLPANFPLPAGTLYGSTGTAPNWVVQLTVAGLHVRAIDCAIAFYLTRSFKLSAFDDVSANGSATLSDGAFNLRLLTSDIDHGLAADTSFLTVSIARI